DIPGLSKYAYAYTRLPRIVQSADTHRIDLVLDWMHILLFMPCIRRSAEPFWVTSSISVMLIAADIIYEVAINDERAINWRISPKNLNACPRYELTPLYP